METNIVLERMMDYNRTVICEMEKTRFIGGILMGGSGILGRGIRSVAADVGVSIYVGEFKTEPSLTRNFIKLTTRKPLDEWGDSDREICDYFINDLKRSGTLNKFKGEIEKGIVFSKTFKQWKFTGAMQKMIIGVNSLKQTQEINEYLLKKL